MPLAVHSSSPPNHSDPSPLTPWAAHPVVELLPPPTPRPSPDLDRETATRDELREAERQEEERGDIKRQTG